MSARSVDCLSYLLEQPTFFFGFAELADYHMAEQPRPQNPKHLHNHIYLILQELETVRKHYVQPLLNLFNCLHTSRGSELTIHQPAIDIAVSLDTISILNNLICRLTEGSKVKDKKESLLLEMSLKVAMNCLYLLLFQLKRQKLEDLLKTVDIEETLMRLIQASLQVTFIPIRKTVIIFYLILDCKFGLEGPNITENDLDQLKNNIVNQQMLQQQTSGEPRLLIKNPNAVESFYKRHNINDCTLAQYIVVGLLRALLTACGMTKTNSSNSSGVDAFREWKTSFIYASEVYCNSQGFPSDLQQIIEQFTAFESSGERKEERNELTIDLDRHRILTAASITSFFLFLLVHFRRNSFLQFSYLLQLISDANGILVLLKFLTDKFQLTGVESRSTYGTNQYFFQRVKLTIQNVLQMLVATCHNYTEKVKSFLFDYNSFVKYFVKQLILKKLPGLFEEDPSITELSCLLLKIQIPFFTKKMKEASNNMKMIGEIYCKCPRRPERRAELTTYQRLLLKNKSKYDNKSVKPKKPKELLQLQDVKNLHLQFNNYNYWHVEPAKATTMDNYLTRLWNETAVNPTPEECERFLQEQVWQYYD